MNVVLTGAAGFIGFHTGLALLKKKNLFMVLMMLTHIMMFL